MVMPHFHGENPVEFRIWCAMAHWQGFASVYAVCIDMLVTGATLGDMLRVEEF